MNRKLEHLATLPEGYDAGRLKLADYGDELLVAHPERPPLAVHKQTGRIRHLGGLEHAPRCPRCGSRWHTDCSDPVMAGPEQVDEDRSMRMLGWALTGLIVLLVAMVVVWFAP